MMLSVASSRDVNIHRLCTDDIQTLLHRYEATNIQFYLSIVEQEGDWHRQCHMCCELNRQLPFAILTTNSSTDAAAHLRVPAKKSFCMTGISIESLTKCTFFSIPVAASSFTMHTQPVMSCQVEAKWKYDRYTHTPTDNNHWWSTAFSRNRVWDRFFLQ